MTDTTTLASRRRYEHWLFSGIALIELIEDFVGFGPTYYFAGVFWAPIPNALVPVHGAASTLFVLLFVAQTLLVASGWMFVRTSRLAHPAKHRSLDHAATRRFGAECWVMAKRASINYRVTTEIDCVS